MGFGVGTAGQFSVNGMRARSNNFSIDGSDNNDPDVGVRRQGFVALVPQSIESIKEVSLSTLLWDSELGRNFGSQVNAVSKYGGNQYHGQLYGFFTDSRLNARNFFDYVGGASGGENLFTRTQAGFVVGGPIVRDRTQFFGSFEHQDVSASTEHHFATPTLAERSFPEFLGGLLGSTPRTFSIVRPSPDFSFFEVTPGLGTYPLGSNVLSLYPLPNNIGGPFGANTYTQVLPADGAGTISSIKLTHQVSANNSLDARYNFTNDNRIIPSVNRAIRSTIEAATRTQDLSLILEIEPFSPVGIDDYTFPQGSINNTFQYADSLAWTIRGHSVKFGGDVRHFRLNSLQDRLYRPLVVYGNGAIALGKFNLSPGDDVPGRFKQKGGLLPLPGVALAAVGLPSSSTPNLGPNVTPLVPVGLAIDAGLVTIPFGPAVDGRSARNLLRPRPQPALGAIQVFENSASSSYHALQVQARKRYSKGYTFTADYTWSHALDDVSDVFPIAGAPVLPQDSLNLRLERGDANFDVRHRFAASFIWELPFYRNSKTGAASLLGGWQIGSIFQAQTGQPFTLNVPFDANLDGNLTDRASTTEGLVFFSGHGARRVALAPGRQSADFFSFGRNGAVGRNTVRGDGFINLDVAMSKRFQLSEKHALDFRAEGFNVMNRANFGLPIRTIGAPGFGSAVETSTPARLIQFALKYSF